MNIKDKKNKTNNFIIFFLNLILIFLLTNMAYSIYNCFDYERRKESGNERWLQVENRILQIEEKINKLEEEK